jgi:hypothetical protein
LEQNLFLKIELNPTFPFIFLQQLSNENEKREISIARKRLESLD